MTDQEPDRLELLQEALAPVQVLELLGAGGMGEIYLARDPVLRRTVAVKVLRSELAQDDTARTRFHREAEVVAGISHPNIISVHAVGQLPDGTPYFVMDYVAGRSLSDRIQESGRVSVREARRILGEVASGLAAAHAKGVVHRDVKPSNVFVDEESGRALVGDFGIAALMGREVEDLDTRLTGTGVVVGSPHFMSPEQFLGEGSSDASDVYALGLLAYELLLGHGPFEQGNAQRMMVAHVSETPTPLAELRVDVDPELSAVVDRCLAKDPDERPEAEAVARQLNPAAGATLEWPPPGLEVLRGAIRPLALLLGLASLSVVGILTLYLGVEREGAGGSLIPAVAGALALAGAGGLVVGVARLMRVAWLLRQGSALGYGWLTLLEVVSDDRDDTGLLLAGSREYAVLTAEERSHMRVRRVFVSLLALFCAALPVPLALLSALLGSRDGALTVGGFLFPVLLPTVGFAAGALALSTMGRRPVQAARKAMRRQQRPGSAVEPLVPAWNDAFHRLRADQAPGVGIQGGGGVVLALVGFLAGLAVLGTGYLAILGGLAAAVHSATVVRGGGGEVPQRVADLKGNAWLRLPQDSSVTAGQAAAWLAQVLGSLPVEEEEIRYELLPARPWRGDRPSDSTIAGSPLLEGDVQPFRTYRLAVDRIIPEALEGLSPAEVAYLEGFTGDPALPAFRELARAPALEIYFGVDFGPNVRAMDVPIPRYGKVRDAGFANLARAGVLAARGDLAAAETALREVVSVALLLADADPWLVGPVVAGAMGVHALSGLEYLYAAQGRTEDLARIREGRRAIAEDDRAFLLAPRGQPDVREVADTRRSRSYRWDLVDDLDFMMGCGSLRAILAGPTDEERDLLARAREGLVRNESEAGFFEVLSTTYQSRLAWRPYGLGFPESWIAGANRAVARMAGNPRLDGCMLLVLSGL